MPKNKQSGFTIVELLIVIVIIGILAAITVVAYNGIQDRARKAAQQSELSQTEKAITTWALQNGGESVSLGSLLAYQENAGEMQLLNPLVGTPDITVYVVYKVLSTTINYQSFLDLQPSIGAQQIIRLQTANTGLGVRVDTPAQSNAAPTKSGIRIPNNTVIGWLQIGNNATLLSFAYNQAKANSTQSLLANTGWNFTSFVTTSNSQGNVIASLIFNAAHDETTRAQVINWLADKYNVSL